MKNNKVNGATWDTMLPICDELDKISTMMKTHSEKFTIASEDSSLSEKERKTLSDLSKHFEDIIAENNKVNDSTKEFVASKGKKKISYEEFDTYISSVDKLDIRMKISGAMIEGVLQRMNAAANGETK